MSTSKSVPISDFTDEFPLGFCSEYGIWTLVGGWTQDRGHPCLVGYFLHVAITFVRYPIVARTELTDSVLCALSIS